MRNMDVYLVVSYTYNRKEKMLAPSKMITIGSNYIDMYLFQKNMGLQKYANNIFLVEKDDVTTDVHLVTKFDGANSMGLAAIAFNEAAGYEFRSGLRKMIMSSSEVKCFDLKMFFDKFVSPRIPNIHDERSREMAKSIVDFFMNNADIATPQPQPNQPVSVSPSENKAKFGVRPDLMISAGAGEKQVVADTIMRSLEKYKYVTVSYNEIGEYIQCNIYNQNKKEMM